MKQNDLSNNELFEMVQKDSSILSFKLEDSLDGIWCWNLKNPKNGWVSPKFIELLGYSFNENKDLIFEWKKLIFPEDLDKLIYNFNKHYQNSAYPFDQILRHKHKDGHILWIRCRGSIIRDKNDVPIRMIGMHNDVTIQKYNEEELLEKTNSLKAILDNSLDGIMTFDSLYNQDGELIDFIYVMSNKKACEIVNLNEEQLIHKQLSKIQPGCFEELNSLNGKTLFEMYKDVVLSGESKTFEFYFESNGIKGWFRNKAVKYNNGFICTFEIITNEKNLQLKLEEKVEEEIMKRYKQEEMLIQQSKMAAMGEMIAAIAHNWRQPLNTVSLLSCGIYRKYESSSLDKEYVNEWNIKMNNQLNFMSQTIEDFKNFYKPTETFKEIFLKEGILKVISLLNEPFEVNGIKIEINIDENITLVCLENQLQQSLLNILSNARDAILSKKVEKGMILIFAERKDSFINLTIQDNGGGIKDKKVLSSIFEPYFTTKDNSEGTGIGLYMCKMIIEQNMKGRIEAKNINHGFEFTIKLPCKQIFLTNKDK